MRGNVPRWHRSALRACAVVLAVIVGMPFVLRAQSAPVFRFLQKPGPLEVGFMLIDQYDFSRTYRDRTNALGKSYRGERARPIRTLIWYPAQRDGAPPMTVGDYTTLGLKNPEFLLPRTPEGVEARVIGMVSTLKTRMWAIRNATPALGRFPVVIYAPSFSSPAWENADLCEYLASYGYVVVASPSIGTNTREMTADLKGVEAQAQDISYLVGYARTLSDADMTKIAVLGYSWGGLSNLFAAARDSRIDALVAFDGSMRYYPGLVEHAIGVNPEQLAIPLLFFKQGEISLEEHENFIDNSDKSKTTGPNVLNEWSHGTLITVDMLGLDHMEFCSMCQRDENAWGGFAKNHKADYVRSDGTLGYAMVARYTLAFLNAYLKDDAHALAFLKRPPVDNGAPKHFMAATNRLAQGVPPSLEGFRSEVGLRGFDNVSVVYAKMKEKDPAFTLSESALYDWSAELVVGGHLSEAVAIRKLRVQIYPNSSNAYERLGDVYVKTNQNALAIDSYRRALKIDPSNYEAKEKLAKPNQSIAQ